MPRLLIIRPIHPLPGRVTAALRWLEETEPIRAAAGQIEQSVLRNVVDGHDFQFVQVWASRADYQRWRQTGDRAKLNQDRQLYLTHDPAKLYEILP